MHLAQVTSDSSTPSSSSTAARAPLPAETASASAAAAQALLLHVRVDALAGPGGFKTLAANVADALVQLDLAHRSSLAVRLRRLLHESIAECASDPAALDCWAGILAASESGSLARPSRTRVREAAPSPVSLTNTHGGGGSSSSTSSGSPPAPASSVELLADRGSSTYMSLGQWSAILGFVVSLDSLAAGLHAVNRCFHGVTTRDPVCWQGRDVTLRQHHFRGILAPRGGAGWCPAFALLPALSQARTLRVAGFVDEDLRKQVLQPLVGACRAFCPRAELVTCSFCEDHHGEQVDLPSPRRLTASRRMRKEGPLRLPIKGGGLLLGNWPLPARRCASGTGSCRTFAIRIERLTPGDRLDVGVTALAPHSHFGAGRKLLRSAFRRKANYAEDLASSWIIESSGLLVGSHAGVRIRDPRWNARNLRAGDDVRLAVTDSGELVLHHNGVEAASWEAQIPEASSIYAVLDLFEGSPQVRLLPDPEPDAAP